jgi:hypothetical protein
MQLTSHLRKLAIGVVSLSLERHSLCNRGSPIPALCLEICLGQCLDFLRSFLFGPGFEEPALKLPF